MGASNRRNQRQAGTLLWVATWVALTSLSLAQTPALAPGNLELKRKAFVLLSLHTC